MPGGAVIMGTTDTNRIEAPVTAKAYFLCAFAAFGGIVSPQSTPHTVHTLTHIVLRIRHRMDG